MQENSSTLINANKSFQLQNELHEITERGALQNVVKYINERELVFPKDFNIHNPHKQLSINGNAYVEEGGKLNSGNQDRAEKKEDVFSIDLTASL